MPSNAFGKLLIGVTGGIGSGKSLACQYFEKLGCEIYYADKIAKELYFTNEKLKAELIKQFGNRILDEKNRIFFPELRKIVFANESNQKRVNKIVHPFVISEILKRSRNYPGSLLVIEAALIFESGFDKYLDYTVAVTSSVKNRVERIRKRNKLSVKTIKSIMKLQMPENEKKARADFVIMNDSTPQELQNKVNFVYIVLKNLV